MKKVINTPNAPLPVGPYSQAISFGNIAFVSGQVPINPETNELVRDTIENETTQVLKNIGAILKEMNASFDNVLKVSVFVKDMGQYAQINEVYARFFSGEAPPARELVEVARLPLDVNIEMSVIVGV
ncbi:MAG TPA: RidA family protein [Saprospiraceae bacterium]|nr:RidA family protein [Saprospiraceae bacterium]